MPENNPRLPKRSWRDNKSAGGTPKQGRRAWQKEPGKEASSGPRFSKRMKITLAGGAFALALSIFIVVLLWPDPIKPFRLVLIDAGYETNLEVPANAYGKNGLTSLSLWAKEYNQRWAGNKDQGIDVRSETLVRDADPMTESLKDCKSPTVLVFLAVHGGVDGQGLYLLPHNANSRKTGARYRFDKVLDALRELPKDKKKYLLLDVTGVAADWPLGMFHNDFASKLESELKEKSVPNLVVLCASDPNQRSWVSEESSKTIFAHYVIEGLKGAAAENGRVTAGGLAKYVKDKVTRWVRQNRAAYQEPRLIDPDHLAATMDLVAAEYKEKEDDPKDPGPFTVPKALRDAWKERFDLEQVSPHPATYTPHWWREYQDTLLRYEELERAGDDTFPGSLRTTLTDLKGRIEKAQLLPLKSRTNALTMSAVTGGFVAKERTEELKQKISDLWKSKDRVEEFQQKLSSFLKGVTDPLEKQVVRELLLQQARQSADEFNRVCDSDKIRVLSELDDGLSLRPAEVHFAVMLQRDLPDSAARWRQVRLALEVRQRAEEAALGITAKEALSSRRSAYSDQIVPWVSSQVEKGDDARRRGENKLFGSAEDAVSGETPLAEADKQYQEILGKTGMLRDALWTRDRALAELSYYTRWRARQSYADFSLDAENQLRLLWDKVHQLRADLDQPNFEKIDKLRQLAAEVRTGLDALQGEFDKSCNDKRSVTQQSWNEIDNLLTVPFIEPTLREELLRELRKIGSELNKRTQGNSGGLDEKQNEQRASEAASRQARLAVAVLGKDNPNAKEADARIPLPDAKGWQEQLVKAGDHVANGFRGLAKEASENAEEGRKSALDKAADILRIAAMNARRLDGGAVAAWFDSGADPVKEYRALQLHNLLTWQARRTYLDYWSSEDETKPYYRIAGISFLDDAGKAVAGDDTDLTDEQKQTRLKAVVTLKQKLNATDRFSIRWRETKEYSAEEKPLHITDENSLVRYYRVVAPEAPPAGELAFWPTKDKSLKRADTEANRQLLKVSTNPLEASVRHVLTPQKTTLREEIEQVTGYYRGRKIYLTTKVIRHNQPDLTWLQHEWPREASLAVRADRKHFDALAASQSELILVLDYSGSMTDKDPQGDSRIKRALDAVEQVLKELPNEVRVGIIPFSQVVGTKPQRKPQRWNRDIDLEREMKKLRQIKPDGGTPLVQAISEAVDLFDTDIPIKKLVVLTDGGDNMFDETPRLKQVAPTIEKYMEQKFKDSRIQLTVIGFEINEEQLKKNNPEEYKGFKSFGSALEKLKALYIPVQKSSELASALSNSLLDIRFQVDQGQPPARGASIRYSKKDRNDLSALGLEAKDHYIYLDTKKLRDKDTKEQMIHLRPGDGMLLNLALYGGSGFQFEREVYADSDIKEIHGPYLNRQSKKGGKYDWVRAVWQSQNDRGNSNSANALQMMVTQEQGKIPVDPGIPLRLEKPELVWFSLATGDAPDRRRSGLRFFPLPDYPAPAWRLEMNEWPRDKDVVLDSWFADVRPIEAARLDRGKDFNTLSELTAKDVDITSRQSIRVESVAWEKLKVEVKHREKPQERNCLVVRLSYPDGNKPFFARLPEGLVVAGYQHCFYTEAGKYTGIFWNVEEDTANSLRYLELISVEQAHRPELTYDRVNLGRPNEVDAPRPLLKVGK